MSSNQSFFNAAGSPGRVNPEISPQEMPTLGVPNNVPMVQPQDIIPDNIGDQQKFSLWTQLGQALGTGGTQFGSNGIAGTLMKNAALKREREQNTQYSAGLVESARAAAEGRDAATELVQNQQLAPSRNPYYSLGLEAGSYQHLAAQYRSDLVSARSENPLLSPQELQQQVKQKYAPYLSTGKPEIVAKFFVEPSTAADLDDHKLFDEASSKETKQKANENLSGTVFSVLTSDLTLLAKGNMTPELMHQNFKRLFESHLETLNSVGFPYRDAVKGAIDTVKNVASSQASLKDKMLVMDSLKEVIQPGGNPLLADSDYGTQFATARESLIKEDAQNRLTAAQALNEEAKAATSQRTRDMILDFNSNKLGPLEQYLDGTNIDPQGVGSIYNMLKSQKASLPEVVDDNRVIDIKTDGVTKTPEQIQQRWEPVVRQNPKALGAAYASAIGEAHQKQLNHEKDSIPRNYGTSIVNEYVKTILPKVDYYTAGWGGYTGYNAKEQAIREIPQLLQSKYKRLLLREQDQFMEKNPHASEGQVRGYLDSVYDNMYKPMINEDLKDIEDKDRNRRHRTLSQILSPNTELEELDVTNPNKSTPKTFNPQVYTSKYPWATNPNLFKQAEQEYMQGKGPIVEYLKANLRRLNKSDMFQEQWKRNSPKGILRLFQQSGYKTFLQDQTGAKH